MISPRVTIFAICLFCLVKSYLSLKGNFLNYARKDKALLPELQENGIFSFPIACLFSGIRALGALSGSRLAFFPKAMGEVFACAVGVNAVEALVGAGAGADAPPILLPFHCPDGMALSRPHLPVKAEKSELKSKTNLPLPFD